MKLILKPLFIVWVGLFLFSIGIVYTLLHLIWSPKGMIKQKKKHLTYHNYSTIAGRKVDWGRTITDIDFWCPGLVI